MIKLLLTIENNTMVLTVTGDPNASETDLRLFSVFYTLMTIPNDVCPMPIPDSFWDAIRPYIHDIYTAIQDNTPEGFAVLAKITNTKLEVVHDEIDPRAT